MTLPPIDEPQARSSLRNSPTLSSEARQLVKILAREIVRRWRVQQSRLMDKNDNISAGCASEIL